VVRRLVCALSIVAIALLPVTVASAAAPRTVAPRTTPAISHSYHVTTTSDAALSHSAPTHTCQDSGDPGQCSYRAAIAVVDNDFGATSNQADTIALPAGDFELSQSISSSSPVITSPGELILTGAGPTKSIVDGATLGFDSGLLNVGASGVDLEISGIEFKGGVFLFGGAISFASDGSLSIVNSAFVANSATVNGGAIYAGTAASVEVSDSTFSGNSADGAGGAIYDESTSPLITSSDEFSHDDVESTGSPYVGGAIDANGVIVASSSEFASDSADGDGGAIFANSGADLSWDLFNNDSSLSGDGGSLYATGVVSDTESSFIENEAGDDGGAIYLGDGGSITGGFYSLNGAGGSGGAIAVSGLASVAGLQIDESAATLNGGAFVVEEHGSLALTDTTVTESWANGAESEDGGGAIFAGSSTSLVVDHDIFGDSKTHDGLGSGGTIFCEGCDATIESSDFLGSGAVNVGGALAVTDNGELTLTDSTLSGSLAVAGGGIYADGANSVIVQGSSISANDALALGGGGVDFTGGGSLLVETSTLALNTAATTGGFGGGLELESSGPAASVILINDTLEGNSGTNGGAIYADGPQVTITASTLDGNHATGGAGTSGGLDVAGGAAFSADSIWASNTGAQCVLSGGTLSSGGDNIDSDNHCGFSAPGDHVSENPRLGSLGSHGGPTQTMLPLPGSPAIGTGGGACPRYDQRSYEVPPNFPCDIGAVFVEATSTVLSESSSSIVRGHEQSEKFTVLVTPTDHDQVPTPGEVTVTVKGVTVCHAHLVPVRRSRADAAVGVCSLSANSLPPGVVHVGASYNGQSWFNPSSAPTRALRVTG
jgi:predicted outer membrane repeat protein